ncbi:uncharacterized protein LOC144352619 [Saccoglossus kowalevskii]
MQQWPDLVGKTLEEAKAKILKDCPDVQIQVLPHDAVAIMTFEENRVRIYVKDGNIVHKTPRIG